MQAAYYPPVTRVEVELTEACNLHCRFCYNSCAPRESQVVKAVLERLAEAAVMEVILTGGEPALHSRFPQLLDVACALFPRVLVQSNGTLFATEAAFEVLRTRPLFCLNFSLHGPQGVHEALTGVPGAFADTCAALRLATRTGIRTASNLVLTSRNADPALLCATVSLLAELGCTEMTVTRFIATGLGRHAPLSPHPEALVLALRTLRNATEACGMTLLLANAMPPCQLPEDLHPLCNRCSFGFDKFYVDVQGQVLTCGMARQPLGNLLNTPLPDLLRAAPLYQRFLTLDHLPSRCCNCAHLDDCGGGCRAAALARTGTLDGADTI